MLVLSARRALRDLKSGLRQETEASVVPCDPGRLLYGVLQIVISVGKGCQGPRVGVCVCVAERRRRCLFGLHAVSVTKAIKRAGP